VESRGTAVEVDRWGVKGKADLKISNLRISNLRFSKKADLKISNLRISNLRFSKKADRKISNLRISNLRFSENGAPSNAGASGALLGDIPWTRMLITMFSQPISN
jgi:hypothetical protein